MDKQTENIIEQIDRKILQALGSKEKTEIFAEWIVRNGWELSLIFSIEELLDIFDKENK